MTRATAGLLWDSLSHNVGDQAVGVAVQRLVAGCGVDRLRPVVVGGEPVPGRHRLLVIGGGELLHPPGHPFYDLFRVPGEHILNTTGTTGPLDAGFLGSYRLAAVRSRWDRDNLESGPAGVGVVPCLTVLFPDCAGGSAEVEVPRGTVGLHLTPASLPAEVVSLRRALSGISPSRALLLSFTPYNQDLRVAQAVAAAAGLPPPLPSLDPDGSFDLVRRLTALVATSLHATIFAYAAGVPFLAVGYSTKVRAFLAERDLGHRLLESLEELPEKLPLLAAGACDWSQALERDRRRAQDFLAQVVAELDRALSAPARRVPSAWTEPTHAVEGHRLMMASHREYGLRVADAFVERAARRRLEEEIEQRDHAQGEVSGYTRRVEEELERTRSHQREVELYVRGLEGQLREAKGRGRTPEPRLGAGAEPPAAEAAWPRRVHAVIVHHRGRRLLGRCLESLRAVEEPELAVIVVANACQEALPEAVASPRCHVVTSADPLGFAAANNLGVAWAQRHLGLPDYYLFLNNDTVVEPTALPLLVRAMEEQPSCGVAGPRLMIWGSGDRLNSLGIQVTRDGNAWDEGIGRRLEDYGPLPGPRQVLAVTGSALVIRSAVLLQLEGWEELYGYYYEDVDLCLRAWSRGWSVLNVPEAVVWHAVSATVESLPAFKVTLTWRNRFLLLWAHWPLWLLLRITPRLCASEVVTLVRRLWNGARSDARLQLAAWGGAVARLGSALARRRRSRGDKGWWRFLHPPGSVPVIELPAAERRGTLGPEESLAGPPASGAR